MVVRQKKVTVRRLSQRTGVATAGGSDVVEVAGAIADAGAGVVEVVGGRVVDAMAG